MKKKKRAGNIRSGAARQSDNRRLSSALRGDKNQPASRRLRLGILLAGLLAALAGVAVYQLRQADARAGRAANDGARVSSVKSASRFWRYATNHASAASGR